MSIPAPYNHQVFTTNRILENPHTIITSDAGTGKTRSVIDAYAQRNWCSKKRMLVLAPLSILEASWGEDFDKFQPKVNYAVAYAKNRERAFLSTADVVLTNHDAVNAIAKNPAWLENFDTLCIDEFTAFKNHSTKRSKAIAKLISHFQYRIIMSGTPNSNGICDIWHPMYLLDEGQRLGPRFYSFRASVCTCKFNGFGNQWQDKDDAEETVAAAISDINVQFKLEDCIDMPMQTVSMNYVTLPRKVMQSYQSFEKSSVLLSDTGKINAVHAGARVKKLLQLCTGAVYDEDGGVVSIHNERYELVMELVSQREHSLVAFNWKHERDRLVMLAKKLNIKHAVIDGSTPPKIRKEVVDRMQAGHLQVVFCHPQSAGHGLTMTKATSVIWASPTYNAEHYQQFNRRIYRAGQTKRTEIIQIAARDTWEEEVYLKLAGKVTRMTDLIGVLNKLNKLKEAA
jgi:SNF2 family DNA or RNA helicase